MSVNRNTHQARELLALMIVFSILHQASPACSRATPVSTSPCSDARSCPTIRYHRSRREAMPYDSVPQVQKQSMLSYSTEETFVSALTLDTTRS